jgi:AcrR family transcriptional regulator
MPSATAARAGGRGAAFAEEGLDVGMAEIARRAGVGNATVFRRFPTKDALYEAIVDEKIAEL